MKKNVSVKRRISNSLFIEKKKNLMLRGKTCDICGTVTSDKCYCSKCWKVVNAVMLEPERFLLVLKKLRNCKLCAKTCKNWEQDI